MPSNLQLCIGTALVLALLFTYQILYVRIPQCDCPTCPVSPSSSGSHASHGTTSYLAVQATDTSEPFDFSKIPEDYQAACRRFLAPGSDATMYSQFRQDWFIFNNYFRGRQYGDGFYIDVGANNPKTLSNTLFFDKCLGWKGICVEPNPIYHKGYTQRSCRLAPHCVWKEKKSLFFDLPHTDSKGTGGMIMNCTEDGVCTEKALGRVQKITCLSLDEIMQQYAPEGGLPQTIDLLSVDVEGFEIDVLQPFNFPAYNISVVTVEINKVLIWL